MRSRRRPCRRRAGGGGQPADSRQRPGAFAYGRVACNVGANLRRRRDRAATRLSDHHPAWRVPNGRASTGCFSTSPRSGCGRVHRARWPRPRAGPTAPPGRRALPGDAGPAPWCRPERPHVVRPARRSGPCWGITSPRRSPCDAVLVIAYLDTGGPRGRCALRATSEHIAAHVAFIPPGTASSGTAPPVRAPYGRRDENLAVVGGCSRMLSGRDVNGKFAQIPSLSLPVSRSSPSTFPRWPWSRSP